MLRISGVSSLSRPPCRFSSAVSSLSRRAAHSAPLAGLSLSAVFSVYDSLFVLQLPAKSQHLFAPRPQKQQQQVRRSDFWLVHLVDRVSFLLLLACAAVCLRKNVNCCTADAPKLAAKIAQQAVYRTLWRQPCRAQRTVSSFCTPAIGLDARHK
jgi:hypothetical protein